MLHFLKFLPQASCFTSVQYGILMDIPKPMIKCCRLIVLICVSVVLPFHKCLRLLRLGLYTVSTPRVDNDAPIVAHICYISLLSATITSIWLVNRKTFVNDTLSSRGTENYYLENAELFCRKLLGCSLALRKSLSLF